mmetsp:Transcript_3942/g.9006  ORF Transcript_3942/g.9006 Transcript_3942/m.9006 type:complete len:192 (+) Transcript_3942:281-856(+)
MITKDTITKKKQKPAVTTITTMAMITEKKKKKKHAVGTTTDMITERKKKSAVGTTTVTITERKRRSTTTVTTTERRRRSTTTDMGTVTTTEKRRKKVAVDTTTITKSMSTAMTTRPKNHLTKIMIITTTAMDTSMRLSTNRPSMITMITNTSNLLMKPGIPWNSLGPLKNRLLCQILLDSPVALCGLFSSS